MKILFDNYNYDYKALKALWGFSIYLEEYRLLFDTGSNGRVLLENMKALGIDVKEVRYLFISHAHWDHIGGLDSVLEANPELTLFVPQSLSKHLIRDLGTLAKEVVVIKKGPQKLFGELYTTGLLGTEVPEQSLIIKREKPVLITGCGHFGVANIARHAARAIEKPIDLVIGGFHLMHSDRETIEREITALRENGVTSVCPTHCSGEKAIAMFARHFGTHYIRGGIGAEID
ncbi:MAG: MBL fold metallo-hydrolase [Candidatus Cloacimonetes bacterium]|nr:MBL fold metallo-hydrolase [Candidatus Cloacimonadota bacterium]MDY0173419.1 MBL fold metallo-hydrolase [Candidatus Cloacimonadaceae bacterium]